MLRRLLITIRCLLLRETSWEGAVFTARTRTRYPRKESR